ncbi:MAG: PilZ domain-containing protein [bacterium]
MAKQRIKERRKHQRAVLELPLDIDHDRKGKRAFKASTVNLSAGGFYCKVPFYLPVCTKLKISMRLPGSSGQKDHVVKCEGTVVRIVPEKPSPGQSHYEIGCFFSDIEDVDRLLIEQYIAEKKSG